MDRKAFNIALIALTAAVFAGAFFAVALTNRYEVILGNGGVIRTDRWTGSVEACRLDRCIEVGKPR